MADQFKPGDHVEWDTPQGTTEGTVERKLTGESHIKGFTAKASKDNPEFLVRSGKSGATAAHKPAELRKKSGVAKKTASTRPTAKKSAAKKTTVKKAAARKATDKKTTAKRSTAKKSAAKKSTAKKSAR